MEEPHFNAVNNCSPFLKETVKSGLSICVELRNIRFRSVTKASHAIEALSGYDRIDGGFTEQSKTGNA